MIVNLDPKLGIGPVFVCDECAHVWLRGLNNHNIVDGAALPTRCAGAGKHRRWDARGKAVNLIVRPEKKRG